MNFNEMIKARYSVRNFKQDEIPSDMLERVLEAGIYCPTACNKQPQKIVVISSKEKREKLKNVCRFTFDAPCIILIGYDVERDWKNKLMPGYSSGETDAAIATTQMMLASWEEGLGTCWVGYFNADAVRDELELPKNLRVTALMPIGFSQEDAKPLDMHYINREKSDIISYM